MIPKTIHYCWFGRGEKTKLAQKCIASWKKYCPDYTIIEWNEDNYDLNSNPYTRYCYKHKKWAYLSDYVRLSVVYDYGGIYFDTDVEVIKAFNHLLSVEAFFALEDKNTIATGLGFGAEQGSIFVKAMMESYAFESEEQVTVSSCPDLNTKALFPFYKDGIYNENAAGKLIILPVEYMNPYDDPTGRLTITEKTISIHWYSKSALSRTAVIRSKFTRPFHRIFGVDCFQWLKKRNGF